MFLSCIDLLLKKPSSSRWRDMLWRLADVSAMKMWVYIIDAGFNLDLVFSDGLNVVFCFMHANPSHYHYYAGFEHMR